MAGTSTEEEDAADKWEWMQNSLFAVGGIYRPCGNGEYVYAGSVPVRNGMDTDTFLNG
jgi:hypothetical protein